MVAIRRVLTVSLSCAPRESCVDIQRLLSKTHNSASTSIASNRCEYQPICPVTLPIPIELSKDRMTT